MAEGHRIGLSGARACFALLALGLVACAEPALADPRLLADFDSAPGRWSFSNGGEFPGGAGGFTIGDGQNGRGGRLAYAFTCVAPNQCGAYVAAELSLPEATPVRESDVLTFAVSPAADADLAIRLTDQSGQTLQYALNTATLEHQAPTGWRRLALPLNRAALEHWGGANTGRVSGGITGISFLARGSAPKSGVLALDDIRLVDVAEQTYTLAARAERTAPVEAPLIGVNARNFDNAAVLDAARAAGVGLVRTDLFWDSVERNGRYDFSRYDQIVRSLAARDMRALLILDYGHPDHGGGGAVTRDADRAAYRAFAAAAATHFRGQPVSFEIWNEPDTGAERSYQAADYARLARETATAIRSADPRAQIVSGGLSWTNRDYFRTMLPGLRGAPLAAIGIHPYRGDGPESAAGDLTLFRGMMSEALAAPAPPLWITEWGFSASVDGGDGHAAQARARQSVLLAREMLTAWAMRMPVAVWYELQDRNESAREAESNFGMLDNQGHAKPAYNAMRAFGAAASGRQMTGILQDLPPQAHGLVLEGANDTLYAVWTEAPGGRLVVTAPGGSVSAQTMFGAPLALDGQRRLVVSESAGPVYLRVAH